MTDICVHLLYYSKIPSASSWAAPVRTTGTVRKKQPVRSVLHVLFTPAESLSSSQPASSSCWASPLGSLVVSAFFAYFLYFRVTPHWKWITVFYEGPLLLRCSLYIHIARVPSGCSAENNRGPTVLYVVAARPVNQPFYSYITSRL
jgi:hypothetical protein